jgi:hypothetical protein
VVLCCVALCCVVVDVSSRSCGIEEIQKIDMILMWGDWEGIGKGLGRDWEGIGTARSEGVDKCESVGKGLVRGSSGRGVEGSAAR